MKRILLILCIFLFVITGCTKSDSVKFKKEYEEFNGKKSSTGEEYISLDIDKDNYIKYSGIDEVIDIINNGTGVIYFGYPECLKCRNVVDVLLDVSDSTSVDTIYYLNVKNIRDRYSLDENGNITTEVETSKEYRELLDVLDSVLDDYILKDSNGNDISVGEKRLYVPLVVFVKNGKIVGSHEGTVPTHIEGNLSKEEREELYDIYKKNIDDIYKSNYCDKESEC